MEILKRNLWMVLIIGGLLLLSAGHFSVHAYAAEPLKLQEQKIKAGLLYNFIKYSSWPHNSFSRPDQPFEICQLGGDSFDGVLDPLQGRTAQQRPIHIKNIDSSDIVSGCHLVFVNKNQSHNLNAIIDSLENRQVLTVSDINGFSDRGGMVEFYKSSKNRISLRLNKNAIDRNGLYIDNKLMKLAEVR